MSVFIKGDYDFWRQVDPKPFNYDVSYKESQGTTVAMSWLRLGVLLNSLGVDINKLKDWWVCDVGSGNGKFAKEASKVFGNVREYDLSGDTISEDELYSRNWDVIFLTDVLEHYSNIEDLFKIKFNYLFLSFPETPAVNDFSELCGWRHYKPDEHIWMLNKNGIVQWLHDHRKEVIYTGNPEDAIRKSPYNVNISTVICRDISR
jgi:hypothetical protein